MLDLSFPCSHCLARSRRIAELEAQVAKLTKALGRRNRESQAKPFGSSTPSSKDPLKANSLPEQQAAQGGAKPGHKGHGRPRLMPGPEDPSPETVNAPATCPDCQGPVVGHGCETRSFLDLIPAKVITRTIEVQRCRCLHCQRVFSGRASGVLPRQAYGNLLLATAVVEVMDLGHTRGQTMARFGLSPAVFTDFCHRLASWLRPVRERLISDFRASAVRFADETTWRVDGRNTYGWLFATEKASVYVIGVTRAASVPLGICGGEALTGSLNVDRYAAYHRLPVAMQYCYAHLLRDVKDLADKVPQHPEVTAFIESLAPRLADAMKLRGLPISDDEYLARAGSLRQAILAILTRPAVHPVIRQFQRTLYQARHKLFLWADNRQIPPDNNFAERGVRRLVIVRKISFGSQSARGAQTREVLMSVLETLRKRGYNVVEALTRALNHLALHPNDDLYPILFPNTT